MAQKATTREEREKLRQLGFVRVDGLNAYGNAVGEEGYVIKTTAGHEGRHDYNNGVIVLNAVGGEVWIGIQNADSNRDGQILAILTVLCPNGRGAFVPCSNGEAVAMSHLLDRFADPDWNPLIISG